MTTERRLPRKKAIVTIEGGGHRVEVDIEVHNPKEAVDLAEGLWNRTKGPDRAGVGFGGQIVERRGAPVFHATGNGAYSYPDAPATA